MQGRITLRKEICPLVITQGVFEFLNEGCMYIAGRDRFYRPVLVMCPTKI